MKVWSQVRYTRRGLAYADDWGTLRNSANSALLALVYARHAPDAAPELECWAQSQLRCAAAAPTLRRWSLTKFRICMPKTSGPIC